MIHVLLQLVIALILALQPAKPASSPLYIGFIHKPTIGVNNGLRLVTFNTKVENHSSNLHYALSSADFVLTGEHKTYQPFGEPWQAYLGPHSAYLFNLIYAVHGPGHYRLGEPNGQHFDLIIP